MSKEVNINELVICEENPRKISKEEMEKLKRNITEFGMVENIVVNSNKDRKNIVVSGNQRVKACKELGLKTIPVYYVDLPREKELVLNIAMNKIGGEFDEEKLSEILNGLDIDDLDLTGFDESELDELLKNIVTDSDELGTDFNLPNGDKEPFQQMTFTLADAQADLIKLAIEKIKKTDDYKNYDNYNNENTNGNALFTIVRLWDKQKK